MARFTGRQKVGQTAYASQVQAQYSHLSPSTSGSSSKSNQKVSMHTLGGVKSNMQISSHNDIAKFTRNIQRGQYSNPEQPMKRAYQQTDTAAKSKPSTPSGASKVNQRVPNKVAAAPDRYRATTPNVMKSDSSGKFLDKSKTMSKLANNMKKR